MLKNRRNFERTDFRVRDRPPIIGPNASGKSNPLDALFTKQVASPGGGFQKAVESRGGMSGMRCPAVDIGARKAPCGTNGIFRTALSAR